MSRRGKVSVIGAGFYGTTTAQRVRLTHLGQLAASVRHEQIASPGLIVIGEVVALAPQLGWFAP